MAQLHKAKEEWKMAAEERYKKIKNDKEAGNAKQKEFLDLKTKMARQDITEQGQVLTSQISAFE